MNIFKEGQRIKLIGEPKSPLEKEIEKIAKTQRKQYALNVIKGLLDSGELTKNDYEDIKFKLLKAIK